MNIELSITRDDELQRNDITLRIDADLWDTIEKAGRALLRFATEKRPQVKP